jgi:peptidyl-prolyl cis-trans isomerase A (cyclophilin A)
MQLHRLGAVLLGVALATSGCDHKNKKDDNAGGGQPAGDMGGSAAAAKPADTDMKPEPVDRGPKQPSPDPTPAAADIRPPTAADLETYAKDIPGTGKLSATIETSLGTLHCELFGDKAPMTVANFIGLATGKKPWLDPNSRQVVKGKPFFDGLTFHRVIPNFMIQGGDPLGVGAGGPGYNFADEIDRSLKMGPGALAMANAGIGDGGGTNGSQFFVMEGARPDLVGHHTIFGQCKELDVVTKITHTPTGDQDKPTTPVTITKLTISKG